MLQQTTDHAHRKAYPEQYTHELCGKKVECSGATFVVERVVFSRFGMLAIAEGCGDLAYAVENCTPIE